MTDKRHSIKGDPAYVAAEQERNARWSSAAEKLGEQMTDLEAKAREIAIRHMPVQMDWSVSPHSKTVWQGNLQDAIAAALREARNSALEEAAGVADQIAEGWTVNNAKVADSAGDIAARIRALKDTTP